ncbi:MAG: DUF5615 family PIN-like protein [Chloroflexi bacterium]|nr:DUF5615 family PIN-like protein [Chloroflexota bacterium]
MKVKLDENLDARLAGQLRQAGHDAATVVSQGASGLDDEALLKLCKDEERLLVTLDVGFANVLRYLPSESPGLVVLRGPNQHFATMRLLVETLVSALRTETPRGRLWIVEPGRLRVHEESEAT